MGWQGILIGFGNCCCWCCWCCCRCCCSIDRSKIMPISLSLKLNICLCPKVIKLRKSRLKRNFAQKEPFEWYFNFNLTTLKCLWSELKIEVKLYLRIYATFSFRTIFSICGFKLESYASLCTAKNDQIKFSTIFFAEKWMKHSWQLIVNFSSDYAKNLCILACCLAMPSLVSWSWLIWLQLLIL